MTSLDVATALDRIAATDAELGAWVGPVTDPGPSAAGPLRGWPLGVKDLIDVRGLSTAAGAYDGSAPPPASADAEVVRRLRAAGAAVLGKTEAVEYGWFGTVRTRHPRCADRSPGGSSSGSAAAVAAGQVRAALGTQTAGSVIRPAAYCGVPAVKWSHGAVPMTGVMPASPSLDSLGAYAASVADLVALSAVALDQDPVVPDPITAAGAPVREIATVHAPRHRAEPGHFSPSLGAAVAEGLAISDADYRAALRTRSAARAAFEACLVGVDACLTPAATSLAPPAGEPGSPACNVPFTLAGLPAVAVPAAEVDGELPVAVQLVGAHGTDLRLLATAAWCARETVAVGA
ncbi:amidase [Pimelobacter simplex]|uniref:Amidase n=1 Tax=Nocardioides simplex TaxID=2045 RepID=A0A7J5E3V0_NOCSI|nr:amidase [Pimelobacter simplex]KAB2812935.1 amidase [Pimelobacter simplex]